MKDQAWEHQPTTASFASLAAWEATKAWGTHLLNIGPPYKATPLLPSHVCLTQAAYIAGRHPSTIHWSLSTSNWDRQVPWQWVPLRDPSGDAFLWYQWMVHWYSLWPVTVECWCICWSRYSWWRLLWVHSCWFLEIGISVQPTFCFSHRDALCVCQPLGSGGFLSLILVL